MSSYRTHSLFHYTRKLDNIINILVSGKLIPNYCSEDLSTRANPNYIIGIPQICFCDIPVSMSDNFVKYYGRYSIGFKKEWGIKNGCNPILYVNNESIIDGMIFYNSIWRKYRESWQDNQHKFGIRLSQLLMEIDSHKARNYMMGFIKKYNGEWHGKQYRNYNENEWRYIIDEGVNDIWWMWEKGEYEKWRGDKKKKKPNPTADMEILGLKFDIEDINHIILYEEDKIPDFINKVYKAFSNKQLKSDEVKLSLLLSKITSFDRIKNDY